MAIDAITSVVTDQTTLDQLNYTHKAKGGKNLGADDFMKLLTVQLQNQDPMKPMEDTAFIAQMASFTSLEQMKALLSEVQTQGQANAANYLGKDVTVIDASSGSAVLVTGTVNSITIDSGVPKIVVNGTPYDLSAIKNVTNPAPAA